MQRQARNAWKAKPQVILTTEGVREIWPEEWGISKKQCMDFIRSCRNNPKWRSSNSVYELVHEFVIPRTRGTGLGLAALMNHDQPLEVNVFISHAWKENAEEFFMSLERSVSSTDVMFICALSLYQCEDGRGPYIAEQIGSLASESPFQRVLEHIRLRGTAVGLRWSFHQYLQMIPMLCLQFAVVVFCMPVAFLGCVPTFHYCAVNAHGEEMWRDLKNWQLSALPVFMHSRHYVYEDLPPAYLHTVPLSLLLFALGAIARWTMPCWGLYRGRVLAVPNSQCDLYSRLWCVYEIFVASTSGIPIELAHTLSSAGHGSAVDAEISNDTDKIRIQQEIADWTIHREQDAVRAGLEHARHRIMSVFSQRLRNGYDRIDHAIRETTQSAHRRAMFMAIAWTLPVTMSQAAVIDGQSFTHDLWQAGGIFGFLIFVFYLFYIAKTHQGVIPMHFAIVSMAVLLSAGSGGQMIAVFSMRNDETLTLRVQWALFFLCLCRTLFHSGISLFIGFVLKMCCSQEMALKWLPFRVLTIIIASAVAIILQAVYIIPTVVDSDDMYPTLLVFSAHKLFPTIALPIAIYSASAHWGVRLVRGSSRASNDVDEELLGGEGESASSEDDCSDDCESAMTSARGTD